MHTSTDLCGDSTQTCSETNVKNTAGTPNLAQENQAIKRQKLEGGRSRQVIEKLLLYFFVYFFILILSAESISFSFFKI